MTEYTCDSFRFFNLFPVYFGGKGTVQVDMSDFKALVSLLRNCSNNLNQIAKRVNSTGNLYQEDVADLQERYRELWGAVSTLLGKLTDL